MTLNKMDNNPLVSVIRGQRKGYIAFIRAGILESEINSIRYYTRTGRPFGSEEFIREMEKRLNRRLILGSPGRPKKEKDR